MPRALCPSPAGKEFARKPRRTRLRQLETAKAFPGPLAHPVCPPSVPLQACRTLDSALTPPGPWPPLLTGSPCQPRLGVHRQALSSTSTPKASPRPDPQDAVSSRRPGVSMLEKGPTTLSSQMGLRVRRDRVSESDYQSSGSPVLGQGTSLLPVSLPLQWRRWGGWTDAGPRPDTKWLACPLSGD